MAGQGSINPYQAPAPAIAGIAAALNAVQSYYGIDTEKARQKLLGVQTDEAQSHAKIAQLDLADQEAMAKGQTSIRQKLKNGAITLSDTPAPTATADTAPAPAKSPVAANDAVASDAVSPLKQSFQKISDVSPSAIAGQKIKDAYGNSHIVLNATAPDGSQIQYYDPKQEAAALETQQKQADLKKTGVETAKTSEELKELPQKQKNEAIAAFRTEATPYKNAIAAANAMQAALTSGNKISESLAQMKSALELTGTKRVGDKILGATEGQDLLSQIENFKEKASTGHPGADELDTLNKAVQTYAKSAENNLTFIAGEHGKQMESVLHVPADQAVSKFLLPTGTGAKYIQTSVRQLPEGERELVIADKDGHWQSIPHNQSESHYTPLQKSILGVGAVNQSVFQSLLGRAGKFLGGGE